MSDTTMTDSGGVFIPQEFARALKRDADRLRSERDEACNKRAEANARISSDSLRHQLMTEELTTLRNTLAAAEGMAEALTKLVSAMEPYSGTTVMLRAEAALVVWREANSKQVDTHDAPFALTNRADVPRWTEAK